MIFLSLVILFGEPLLAHLSTESVISKNPVTITSYFGERVDPITKALSFHSGIDLAGKLGSKVRAIGPGQVAFTGMFKGYGNLVVIRHGKSITSLYAHLDSFGVRVGEFVKKGDELGRLGSTGRSTGPHLHFEMRLHGKPFDPLKALPE